MTSSGPQTRGFLFADLRGYSAYTERHGDMAATELLGRYRDLVRREIAAFHGAEIRTEGDSFYVVFDSVSDAVQAAVAIRDATAADEGADAIRVGIGIHAGEATDGEQGIVSSAVNIAARVCAQAEAGEVLVTETVRSLTRTYLPFGFVSRGARRLKGISEPIRLFRVEAGNGAAATTFGPLNRSVMALAAFAAAALLIAAAIGGLGIMTGWTLGSPTPASSTVPIAASLSPGASGAFSVDPDSYTAAAAQALIERLPDDIAGSCERADVATRPAMIYPDIRSVVVRDEDGNLTRVLQEGTPDRLPLAVSFGVSCLANATRVVFWQASSSQGGAEELFFNVLTRKGVPEGTCVSGGRAYEAWEAGAHSGHLMCYSRSDGASALEWTYADENIYAIATRRDDDGASLYAWWRDVGRLLSR